MAKKKFGRLNFAWVFKTAAFFAAPVLIAAALNMAAFAEAPQISQPKAFQSGIYIQPSEASDFIPTPIPKGIGFYMEFVNVPDYGAYAKVNSTDCVFYETKYGDFYYLDNSRQVFTYTSKVYDYFNVDAQRYKEYKDYLERLGFVRSDELAYAIYPDKSIDSTMFGENPEYLELIKDDILYDPDFVMDTSGVYSLETEYGYTIVVFGDSSNYHGGMKPEPCNEIRLYNLFCDYDVMGSIMNYVNAYDPNERMFYYYVTERQAYVPFSSQAIGGYVEQNGPIVSEDSLDEYIQRMLRYLGE